MGAEDFTFEFWFYPGAADPGYSAYLAGDGYGIIGDGQFGVIYDDTIPKGITGFANTPGATNKVSSASGHSYFW